jgi:hypothetical protein
MAASIPQLDYSRLGYEDLSTEWETRILKLKIDPLRPSSIRGEIEKIDLTAHPEYCALSYSWGTEEPSVEIEVNGKPLKILPTLHAALVQLHRRYVTRIWVDVLSIKQTSDNIREKNQQIKLMDTIFQEASMVYAWLGEESEDSVAGIHFLKRHYHNPDGQHTQFRDWFSVGRSSIDAVELRGNVRKAIFDLVHRPYWRRVWILQEICKAKSVKVLCGRHELDFDTFMHGVLTAHRSSGRTLIPKDHLDLLEGLKKFLDCEASGSQMTLIEALLTSQRSLARDPRDKLYALYSLAHDHKRMLPIPNYQDDPSTVYRKATKKMISQACPNVILLARSRHEGANVNKPKDHRSEYHPIRRFLRDFGRETGESASSWVPNWNATQYIYPEWIVKAVHEGQGTFAMPDHPEEQNQLHMDGVALERLIAVAGIAGNTRDATTYTGDQLYSRSKRPRLQRTLSTSAEDALKDLWDILTFGQGHPGHECRQHDCVAREKWPSYEMACSLLPPEREGSEDLDVVQRWFAMNGSLSWGGKKLGDLVSGWHKALSRRRTCRRRFTKTASWLAQGMDDLERQHMRIAFTDAGRLRLVYREARPGDQIFRLRLRLPSSTSSASPDPTSVSSPSDLGNGPSPRQHGQVAAEATSPRSSTQAVRGGSRDVSFPVVLRRREGSNILFKQDKAYESIGEVFLIDWEGSSDNWLHPRTGWSSKTFAEERWKSVVIR